LNLSPADVRAMDYDDFVGVTLMLQHADKKTQGGPGSTVENSKNPKLHARLKMLRENGTITEQ